MGIVRFLKDWTLPVAIAVGTSVYLLFYWAPPLDAVGAQLSPLVDRLLPVTVFLTLFLTFCKVDFHQMLPHRWHAGVLGAQLLLVGGCVGYILAAGGNGEGRTVGEAVLTCIIGPSAAAAPVVTAKLGGNISTMTTYTVLSSVASALLIPLVFPLLEPAASVTFVEAVFIIMQKVAAVLLLPLVLGWAAQHYWKRLCRLVTSVPNLSFYTWAVSLSLTTGITVKNIVHSEASVTMLGLIALATMVLCLVQFLLGRLIGRRLGEEINAGQALFQKNTALSIWVAYIYLNPVASVGAGCYVLWQNIVNSLELRHVAK